jgi:tetratricopeptide (TPR) repeat protein
MIAFCKPVLPPSVFLIVILASQTFSQGSLPVDLRKAQISEEGSAQAESLMDQGICAFKDKKYPLAQEVFEKARELDPANKLLLVFAARAKYFQYQPHDRTPANIAKARTIIEAYEKVLAGNPGDPEAVFVIVGLYEQTDPEHLREIAANENLPREVRKSIYSKLAAKANSCANDITAQNRTELRHNGHTVYRYNKPRNPADLTKAKACAGDGLNFVEKAIALAPDDEAAWSYKASLLTQMSRLGEMEQNPAEKAAYGKQAEEAISVFRRISGEVRDRQKKADEAAQRSEERQMTDEERQAGLAAFISTGTLRREHHIDSGSIDSPLISVLPSDDSAPPRPPTTKGTQERKADHPIKTPWKSFTSSDGEFTALMPSPVAHAASDRSYTVTNENIAYFISVTDIPPSAPVGTDVMLATAAYGASDTVCNFSLMAKSTCEIGLVGKLTLNGYPGAQYRIAEINCDKVNPGVMRVYAVKDHIFVIIVTGANEDDPRVSRFLSSFSPAK